MKVSILTYHWEDNYGATMQAYATYKAIAKLGHIPEFIDLRLPYNPTLKSRIIFALKRYRFNRFRKKFFKNLTPKTYWSVQELRNNPPVSDCYLVGSDQTWNPQIAKSLLPAFFLTFGSDNVRRISYATSIGLNDWEQSSFIPDKEIKLALSKFHSILLREDSAISICKTNFGANARQVIDPVLLFNEYPELSGEIHDSNEVITYKLINDGGFYEYAKDVANELELPIRSIGSVRHPNGYKASYPESVENWIKRIAGASLVITDSFHGTVFSLLYHRPFVIYIGDSKRITRIHSLLKILGLENRILSKESSKSDMKKLATQAIDWERVDYRLDELRKCSWDLLKDALR